MLLFLLLLAPLSAMPDSTVTFVGSTPCDEPARQFIRVPAGAECERIQWTLGLPSSDNGTFALTATWGVQAVNNPGFAGGGNAVRIEGTVTAANRERRTYRLAAESRSLELVHLDADLIHVVAADGAVMLGNPGWSYTLTAREPSGAKAGRSETAGSGTVSGVFEGRTPCEAIERLLSRPRNPACTKVKWRLTFRDNSYALEGFGYARNGTPPRTGNWRASGTTIQLDPGKQPFLAFRLVDGRLLMFLDKNGQPLLGDEYYSYTLNRIR